MNTTQMTAVLGHAAAVYSKPITPELVDAWLGAVGDLPSQLVATAIDEHIRHEDWFPKPAGVRRIAIRIRDDQARNAEHEHRRRFGTPFDQAAAGRSDGYAMVSFVLGRLRAAGCDPIRGAYLTPAAAGAAASGAIDEWRAYRATGNEPPIGDPPPTTTDLDQAHAKAIARNRRERAGRPRIEPRRQRQPSPRGKPPEMPEPVSDDIAALATQYLIDGHEPGEVAKRLGISRRWCYRTATRFGRMQEAS